ncbi:MAG: hypothetical protein ATN35_03880 [Epulopiscium sp. Nele67-Bin004]|nr:MAG: hypothetical protein ATN35_03880 [Epulopiscium sp. Nele67-Bin004]
MATVVPTTYASTEEVTLTADDYATYLVENLGLPSIQYAMIKDGEIVTSGATGVYSLIDGTPITTDHVYAVGSVSKMYTTASIMKLVDMGLVELDAPVTTYVDDFVMNDERYIDITVRMLLNHSSGIMEASLSNAILYGDNDTSKVDGLIQSLATQRLKADPGEFSVYNNGGFTLAEIVVERVSGMSFTEFIETYISEPLGLSGTHTPKSDFDLDNVAKGYGAAYMGEIVQDSPTEMLNLIGTGGMYSTAEELCLFADAFFLGEDMLTKESIDMTKAPEYQNGLWLDEKTSMEYGLGWDEVNLYPFNEQDVQVLVKGGDTLQYHASLVVAPDHDIAVAVLSSGGSSSFNMSMAGQMLLDELIKDGVMEQPAYEMVGNLIPEELIPIPAETMEYAGHYANFYGAYEFVMDEQGIMEVWFDGESAPIYHIGNGQFTNEYGMEIFEFVELDDKTYLKAYATAHTGLLPFIGDGLYYQKLEPKEISDELKQVWETRLGKTYYYLNEKYTSLIYTEMLLAAVIYDTMDLEGYVGNSEIIDENTLHTNIQIPGMMGRDTMDYYFYEVDGVEYLEVGGSLLVDADQFGSVEAGVYEIGADGYAQFFTVDEDVQISVEMTGDGIFALYDADMMCVYHSLLEPNKVLEATEGYTLMFAGEVGTNYTVK